MRIRYKFITIAGQEDQLIPQYYYVSTSNKHVNKDGWKTDDYMTLLVVFADRTRSKFTIDCCWPMFNFDFNSSKCCCKVQMNM